MATKNRVRWDDGANLTRQNMSKMSEDILRSATIAKLKTAQENLQNAFSTKTIQHGDTSTLIVKDGTRAEVYAMGKENLLTAPYEGGKGNFTNHLNPLPAGDYIFYVANATTGTVNFTFKYRVDRTEEDPTDTDNLLIVTSGTLNLSKQKYHSFSAPNGIDFITTTTTAKNADLVLIQGTGAPTITYKPLTEIDNTNLMPYPYQYDYERSEVDKFIADPNSFVIDTLKFTDEGDGCILVERANPSVGKVNKEIILYFHYGTEMKLPAGTYTFGCKVYNAQSGSLWGSTNPKAYCRVLARWEDGDSKSYYTSSSTQKLTNNQAYTFDAYNGINSIICCLRFQANITDFAVNGLRFKPTLCKGDTEIEFTPYTNRNIAYKYSRNLLRPSSPRLCDSNYDANAIGTLGNTQNGITLTKLGGGYYALNGTATAYTRFQIGIGRRYMRPVGTLRFGSIAEDAPAGLELRMTIGRASGGTLVKAYAGQPAEIVSTVNDPMLYYTNTLVVIPKGTVCNNVLIAWQLTTDGGSIETFDRFKMPVASGGYAPMMYDYYKVADSTYVGNPAFNLAAKVFRPPTVTDFIAALPMYNGEAVEE